MMHFSEKGLVSIFPIPQDQISLTVGPDGIPKMKQNPGLLKQKYENRHLNEQKSHRTM